MVKTTPPATDSPAEPIVCTMLFSRIVEPPNCLSTEMASTAIGIDARHGEAGAQAEVHGGRAEEQAEEHAEDDRLGGELGRPTASAATYGVNTRGASVSGRDGGGG